MQGVALISNGKAWSKSESQWRGNVQSRGVKAMQRIEEICGGVERRCIAKAKRCNEWN
nr:MAG TPA: hypothetical protein [Caudoviricetes sp.]